MAPFTSRQTNYIRAIAGQQQHKTLIARQAETDLILFNPPNLRNNTDVKLYGRAFHLNNHNLGSYAGAPTDPVEAAFDKSNGGLCNLANDLTIKSGNATTDPHGRLRLLRIPAVVTTLGAGSSDPNHVHVMDESQYISSDHRAGVEGYLESTHLKLFCTLPVHGDSDNGVLGSPHYEFRIIVFRNKLPVWAPWEGDRHDRATMREGVSLLNPNYDLFMGQTGRARGFLGWRKNKNFDLALSGDQEVYQGQKWVHTATSATAGVGDVFPSGELLFTPKDYMTMPLNRNDYVIHTDQRFFLGKEHGKSHMEKEFHFDWNDFVDTADSDLTTSPTLDKKNYDWHFIILGTSNSTAPADLNLELRATTAMKSGM
jgi:hypothetical protein